MIKKAPVYVTGAFFLLSSTAKPPDFISTTKKILVLANEDLTAEEGFEPSQTESESAVLPLHNSAILTLEAHSSV